MDALVLLGLGASGFVGGTFGALAGVGGGLLLVPILLVAFGLPPQQAVGTSLPAVFAAALSGTFSFLRHRRVDLRAGLVLGGVAAAGGVCGAWATKGYSASGFDLSFGVVLVLAAAYLFARRAKDKSAGAGGDSGIVETRWGGAVFRDVAGGLHEYRYSIPSFVLLGAAAGILSGALGIGGGILMTPVFIYFFAVPAHVATATSQFVILFASGAGIATHASLDHVRWTAVPPLVLGAMAGAQFGAWLSIRVSSRGVVLVLASAILLAGGRLIARGW